jgi:hypothetical protein
VTEGRLQGASAEKTRAVFGTCVARVTGGRSDGEDHVSQVQNRIMAPAGEIRYPTDPAWCGPEVMLLKAAAGLFYISFGALALVLIVGGAVSGTAAPVVFGILVAVIYGSITWNAFHLASRLEFSDGRLSWESSLPWSLRTRPGRVRAIRWPASSRSRYVRIELDDGRKLFVLPRRGLMEFINSVHDVEPAILVDVRTGDRNSKWMTAVPAGYLRKRAKSAAGHRSFRIAVSMTVSLLLLGLVAEFTLTGIGGQENFRTLRNDLANVRLPPGYGLVTEHQVGTDCAHEQCSLTQTWRWAPSGGRTTSAACSDVFHAMTSAFSGVDSNSPVAPKAACDYYAVLGSVFHPGQGKRTVEAIVKPGLVETHPVVRIELTASYG